MRAFSISKGQMTILIVEDNAGIRRIIRRAVDHVATHVCECEDGIDALAAYSRCLPDLVLMDIRMPGMDGLVATRQIRAKYPKARIIMVTDYDDEGLRAAASETGACGYALKQNLIGLEHLISTELARSQSE
jgi:CheY-like chemotaxis protein